MSLRTELMEKYGLDSKQAKTLISNNAFKNEGKIDFSRIEEVLDEISEQIVFNIGYLYSDYDVKHELIECGKDRQESAMRNLVDDSESFKKAQELLPGEIGYYGIRAENMEMWVNVFYSAARKRLSDEMEKGIDNYREFVSSLPFENINRVASVLNMEDEVAEFLAKNGSDKDFEKFMVDERYLREPKDGQETQRRACPRALREKMLIELQYAVSEGKEVKFDREKIMRALNSIQRHKDEMTPEQKSELESELIEKIINGGLDDELFNRFARFEMSQPYENLMGFLEVSKDFEKSIQYATNALNNDEEEKAKAQYDKFLSDLENEEELTQNKFLDILKEDGLSRSYLETIQNENGENEVKLVVYRAHPFGENIEPFVFKFDGSKIKEVVDELNQEEKDRVSQKMAKFAENGIGEISVEYDYYSDSDVVGNIKGEEDASLINENNQLDVSHKFSLIDDDFWLKSNSMRFTPEQIQQFNEGKELPRVVTHGYTIGKVDGYHDRTVHDFELNGEQYHVKDCDWTNGGFYTVLWNEKGQERSYNHPNKAIGIDAFFTEWGRCVRPADIDFIIKFMSQNPNRFEKYISENAREMDCCGVFDIRTIDRLVKEIIQMPKESELMPEKTVEKESAKPENLIPKEDRKFVNEVVDLANEENTLGEKAEQAKNLNEKYEEIEENTKGLDEQ